MSDSYTEKQIRDAIVNGIALADGKHYSVNPDDVIAALKKPKPKFAKGEVYGLTGIHLAYFANDGITAIDTAIRRPLTLTEHGPAVRALRDAMEKIRDRPIEDCIDSIITMQSEAEHALKAFDEAIKDD